MVEVSSTNRVWLARCAAIAAAAALWLSAASASAADKIYWTNKGADTITSANLAPGGGGETLSVTGADTPSTPQGVAIDAAAGRIYWADAGSNRILHASLSGGDGQVLNTSDATVDNPTGLAIDPAGGRIYWANQSIPNPAISYAELDGSGSGDLDVSGKAFRPQGVAVDPAANKIYWANRGDNKIAFANLDGSGGGGYLDIGLATTPSPPTGVAIDKAAGKVYWAAENSLISFANLAPGGGGGDLSTASMTLGAAEGAAIDPVGGDIYWPNDAGSIAYAALDDSGDGAILDKSPLSTLANPRYPAILRSPSAAGAPQVTGGSLLGSTLTCSNGVWAPDLPGAHLSRAPASFADQWSRDGADIGGATSSTLTADQVGTYACKVTATNFAGSASQTSAGFAVKNPNDFTLGKAKANKKKGTAKLPVSVPGAGSLELSGSKVKPSTLNPSAAGDVDFTLKAKGKAKKKLKKKGKTKVSFDVAFSPTGGDPKTESGSVKLVKKNKH